MKYLFRVLLIFQFSMLHSAVVDPNSGWSYVQSVEQAFHVIINTDQVEMVNSFGGQINANGDGNLDGGACSDDPTNCDALGAFKSHTMSSGACNALGGIYLGSGICDICVGWVYYNTLEASTGGLYNTTLPLMGNDGSGGEWDYYLETGDIPTLKLYDASEGVTYSLSYSLNLDSNLSITEFANNEITVYYDDCEEVELPDCEDEVTYDCCASISFIANCQFDSDSNGICDEIDDGSVVLGCTSESACNYDSDADFDDGSCEYPEENYDCDGNCVVDEDCAGECGGGALVDECGVCEGPGAVYDCGCSDIPEGACDCDGNVLDECGVCQGDNSTCTGCTDQEACNYDADATINGECEYPDEGFDCNGNALNNDLTSPDSFEIVSIYPNPFNPSTHVRYALASTELIDIRVLNSNGNEIELLFSGYKIAGYHDFSWAPHSNTPSGHYFIQINTSNNSLIKKVTFLK